MMINNSTIVDDKNIISTIEQKQIMLDMLKYIDEICRKNNIKYSLIGGSLIGAIRHKGFVPWDDDIDIILLREDYEKLKEILMKVDGKYQLLKYGQGGERFGFMKLIDTRTRLVESTHPDFGKNYGIFIDIFGYFPTPNDYKLRLRHYKKIKLLRALILRRKLDFKNYSLIQNFRWIVKNIVSSLLGYKRIKRMFEKVVNKYKNEDADYLVNNWPTYGFEREIELKKNTEEYIDAEFEGLKAMIFKNYDEVLKNNFGDYMQLPPESERVPGHSMTMWWRESNE